MENQINRSELISLYGLYMSILPTRWEKMHSYVNVYISLIVSVLGVTIAGINSFDSYPVIFILLLGPIVCVFLSSFAKKTIKRQNENVKEIVAMLGKIGFELGLYEKLRIHTPTNGKVLWEDDENFLLPRWVEGRINSGKTSEEFITNFQKSSIKYAYNIFTLLQITSIVLIIFIIIFPLISSFNG